MMLRYLSSVLVLASLAAGGTLRAATEPHAAPALQQGRTWTNEDVEQLSEVPGLISIVGRPSDEHAQNFVAPDAQSKTRDAEWYAAEAASLNARLKSEQAQLHKFAQALDDVRELKTPSGGLDLFQDEIALTPEATIDALQNRISQTQIELDALKDLARRNGIEPGILRGSSYEQESQLE